MEIKFIQDDYTIFLYNLFTYFNVESYFSPEKGFEIGLFYEIDPESNMDITIYKEGGVLDHFVYNIDRFLSTRGKAKSFVELTAGKYRLAQKDGTILFFNDPCSCKVTGIYLQNGEKFHFTYNDQKQLVSIKKNFRYTLSLTRKNEEIRGITETVDFLNES